MRLLKFIVLLFIALLVSMIAITCTENDEIENSVDTEVLLDTRSGEIGKSCLPEINGSGCVGGVYSWNIELDLFPGCSFPVSVDYVKCWDGFLVNLHLGDFEIDYDNLYCQDYYDYIDDCVANGTIEDCIIEFNQAVWEQVTLNILNGSNMDPTYPTSIEYYVGACKFLCEYETLDCVESGTICCAKEYVYVYDNAKRKWVVNWEGEAERIGGECPEEPITPCSQWVIQTAQCFDNCASLDFFDE